MVICCECSLKITDNNKKILNCDHEIHDECINIALSKSKKCPLETCKKNIVCSTCSELLIKDHTCKYVCRQCEYILKGDRSNDDCTCFTITFFIILWSALTHGFHDKERYTFYNICEPDMSCHEILYGLFIFGLLWLFGAIFTIIEIIIRFIVCIILFVLYLPYYFCLGIIKCPKTCYEYCYILRNNYKQVDNTNNV